MIMNLVVKTTSRCKFLQGIFEYTNTSENMGGGLKVHIKVNISGISEAILTRFEAFSNFTIVDPAVRNLKSGHFPRKWSFKRS